MNDTLVIALDFGTSSVRAIVFDARGREVDIDGNNTVDMTIFTPGATLHAADFLL